MFASGTPALLCWRTHTRSLTTFLWVAWCSGTPSSQVSSSTGDASQSLLISPYHSSLYQRALGTRHAWPVSQASSWLYSLHLSWLSSAWTHSGRWLSTYSCKPSLLSISIHCLAFECSQSPPWPWLWALLGNSLSMRVGTRWTRRASRNLHCTCQWCQLALGATSWKHDWAWQASA